MAGSGTTKKVTVNQILGCGGTATLASATITGDLTVDTSTLKVDSANNRVGVGTASPASTLDLSANDGTMAIFRSSGGLSNDKRLTVKSGGGSVVFDISDNSNTATSRAYEFNQAGTLSMSLSAIGNFAVGVTPSAWGSNNKAIQVGANSGSISSSGSGNTSSRFSHGCYFDGTNWLYSVSSVGAARYEITGANAGSTHAWYTSAGGTSGNTITFTTGMTLDASSNLAAGGYVRAAARTQIGAGYIGDINVSGNNRGLFFGSGGLLPANGTGTSSDNSYNLGSGTERWATVYAGTGTINTSDRNEKQDIDDLSASEKRVASSIKQLVKKYRFKDAVASKGENARIHVGWIAQDVQSAFAAEGLDASDYGMFCSDSWYEVNGSSVDSDGKPYTSESENAVAKTRLGLRHDELLAFVVSSL
jgi:hypothetical protein